MTCAYCPLPATLRIPATPGEACLAHTIEFWTGFLKYAKDHPVAAPALPTEPDLATQRATRQPLRRRTERH